MDSIRSWVGSGSHFAFMNQPQAGMMNLRSLTEARLLSVGRFGSGTGSVFRYSRYSMGSLRGGAPHNSRVGGSGGKGGGPPPQFNAAAAPSVRLQNWKTLS